MVAHVDAGLVDVGGPHKRRGVPLEHQHPLAPPAALQRRVQAVQPGADDDLVHRHGDPLAFVTNYGLYFPASVASSTFISSLLPLKPLILVGVAPVAG